MLPVPLAAPHSGACTDNSFWRDFVLGNGQTELGFGDPGADWFMFDVNGSPAPGSFSLGTGPNANFATCSQCTCLVQDGSFVPTSKLAACWRPLTVDCRSARLARIAIIRQVNNRRSHAMEHDMKISPAVVRRLRSARGWPQEQLAVASGLSLRTIQRVESAGIASMATVVSLGATFGVQVIELQDVPAAATVPAQQSGYAGLFLGIVVLMIAALGESGRLPGLPVSNAIIAINLLALITGVLLLAPPLVRLVRQRQYLALALATLGTPFATLLAAGGIHSIVSGHAPSWQLAGMGAAGVALMTMAARELRRPSGPGSRIE